MSHETPPRHILVDLENVPAPNLAPLAGISVEITILVGEKNKKLGIELVEQLLAGGPRVHLIRVGATGRNALDLTLSYYLGKAVTENPRATFFIISKDGDYDAMVAHLQRIGVTVSRHASVEVLPFVAKPGATAPAMSRNDRLAAYAIKLRQGPGPRDLAALRKKILNDLKKHIPPDGVDAVIHWLTKEKVVEVGPDEKVKVLPAS